MTLPAERDLDTPARVIPFAFEQMMKNVWTSMPGIVESYDAATRRAVVRPALEACLSDGSTVRRRPIANVPVVSPACGGVSATVCLVEGDAVWLSFSMRGLAAFLLEFTDAPATLTSFFSATDAVCFPGFGPGPSSTFRPASDLPHGFSSGISLQSNDGSVHVSVSEDAVRVRAAGDTQVDVLENEVVIKAAAVKIESGGTTYTFDPTTGKFA